MSPRISAPKFPKLAFGGPRLFLVCVTSSKSQTDLAQSEITQGARAFTAILFFVPPLLFDEAIVLDISFLSLLCSSTFQGPFKYRFPSFSNGFVKPLKTQNCHKTRKVIETTRCISQTGLVAAVIKLSARCVRFFSLVFFALFTFNRLRASPFGSRAAGVGVG